MNRISFYILPWLIFSGCDWINAKPLVGTIVRSAQDKEFSSVVSIGYKYSGPELALQQFCTGTLISKRHIITAAHCIESKEKENVQVFGGSSRLKKCDRYDIEDWITYNDWAEDNNLIPKYTMNDIAIITLARDADRKRMKPALVSPELNVKHERLIGAIAGWGRLNDDSATEVMQTAPIQILTLRDCRRRLTQIQGSEIDVPARYMCSAAKAQYGEISSNINYAIVSSGDSGGPLFNSNKVLIGVNVARFLEPNEAHKGINIHVGLHYYVHFLHRLQSEGLEYKMIHYYIE